VAGTARFRGLVTDLTAALDRRGLSASPAAVASMLEQRITTVAELMGITAASAMRSYFAEDWAEDMAGQVAAQQLDRERNRAPAPSAVLPVEMLARLVAGMG